MQGGADEGGPERLTPTDAAPPHAPVEPDAPGAGAPSRRPSALQGPLDEGVRFHDAPPAAPSRAGRATSDRGGSRPPPAPVRLPDRVAALLEDDEVRWHDPAGGRGVAPAAVPDQGARVPARSPSPVEDPVRAEGPVQAAVPAPVAGPPAAPAPGPTDLVVDPPVQDATAGEASPSPTPAVPDDLDLLGAVEPAAPPPPGPHAVPAARAVPDTPAGQVVVGTRYDAELPPARGADVAAAPVPAYPGRSGPGPAFPGPGRPDPALAYAGSAGGLAPLLASLEVLPDGGRQRSGRSIRALLLPVVLVAELGLGLGFGLAGGFDGLGTARAAQPTGTPPPAALDPAARDAALVADALADAGLPVSPVDAPVPRAVSPAGPAAVPAVDLPARRSEPVDPFRPLVPPAVADVPAATVDGPTG